MKRIKKIYFKEKFNIQQGDETKFYIFVSNSEIVKDIKIQEDKVGLLEIINTNISKPKLPKLEVGFYKRYKIKKKYFR